jgi:hypothetical protein
MIDGMWVSRFLLAIFIDGMWVSRFFAAIFVFAIFVGVAIFRLASSHY